MFKFLAVTLFLASSPSVFASETVCKLKTVGIGAEKRVVLSFSKTLKDGTFYEKELPEISKHEPAMSPDYLNRLRRVIKYRAGVDGRKIEKELKCDRFEGIGSECKWEIQNLDEKSKRSDKYVFFRIGDGMSVGEDNYSMKELKLLRDMLQEIEYCKPSERVMKFCEFEKNTPSIPVDESSLYDFQIRYKGAVKFEGIKLAADPRIIAAEICESPTSVCPDGIIADKKPILPDAVPAWCGNQVKGFARNNSRQIYNPTPSGAKKE
jgi:hypothetical protein